MAVAEEPTGRKGSAVCWRRASAPGYLYEKAEQRLEEMRQPLAQAEEEARAKQ